MPVAWAVETIRFFTSRLPTSMGLNRSRNSVAAPSVLSAFVIFPPSPYAVTLLVVVAALDSVRLGSFISGAMNPETTAPAKQRMLVFGRCGIFHNFDSTRRDHASIYTTSVGGLKTDAQHAYSDSAAITECSREET